MDWTENTEEILKSIKNTRVFPCDWSRDAFTLDENLSKAVEEVFIRCTMMD